MPQNVVLKINTNTTYDTLYPSVDATTITTGTLGVANGGTGQTSLEGLKSALGIESSNGNGVFYCHSYEDSLTTNSGEKLLNVSISESSTFYIVWAYQITGNINGTASTEVSGLNELHFVPLETSSLILATRIANMTASSGTPSFFRSQVSISNCTSTSIQIKLRNTAGNTSQAFTSSYKVGIMAIR